MPTANAAKRCEALLREFALAYPEAHEDFPWGERVIKVRGKVFVFLGCDGEGLGLSVKLPVSGELALALPFASRTGYNLGKSGWVSAQFGPREKPPVDMLREWIDESYRAVAPKKLVASLPGLPGQSQAPAPEKNARHTRHTSGPARSPKRPLAAGSKRR